MLGKGLLEGMGITLKNFFSKKVTVDYPFEKIPMTPLFRGGTLDLRVDKCIACGMCAMSCPNNVIKLTTEKDEATNKKRLSTYWHYVGLCLYCNLCVEACPTDAITWDQNYENTVYFRDHLKVDCMARDRARIEQEGPEAPADTAAAETGTEAGKEAGEQ